MFHAAQCPLVFVLAKINVVLVMNDTIDSNNLTLDHRLLKFKPVDKRLIDALVNSRLWCAKLKTLNDPFDCQLELGKSWERAADSVIGERRDWLLKHVNDKELFAHVKSELAKVGVCSFSLDRDNHLATSIQWSHYADEHKGVCLIYRFPDSFFHSHIFKNKIHFSEVTYGDNVLTDWLKNEALMNGQIDDFLFGLNGTDGLVGTYLRAKSITWKDEHEVRIIRRIPGFLNIPFGVLEQVCFGLRTSQDDIELVKKLAKAHSRCENFCQLIRDDNSDFGIKVETLIA